MEPITIEKEEYGFNVRQGNRYSEAVSYDEMLGIVSSLTMPDNRPCLQWMKTREQHEYQRALMQKDFSKPSSNNTIAFLDYDKRTEEDKCRYYRSMLHQLCKGECIELKEKVWIQTCIRGYEFTACKVIDLSDYRFQRIEIYNEDGGIHCSAALLKSNQLAELARVVSLSKNSH